MDAARRLLVRRGFQDVALDDVARAAGVAKGTLFLYYKSKEELVSSAMSDLVDQLGETLDALASSGLRGERLLRKTVLEIVSYFDRNRDFIFVGRLPGCGARCSERTLAKYRENHARLAAVLRRVSRDAGLRPARDLSFEAALLFGLCRSSMIHRSLNGRAESAQARSRKVARFFFKGAFRR